jgi:iron complex transport system substrate-binding protein
VNRRRFLTAAGTALAGFGVAGPVAGCTNAAHRTVSSGTSPTAAAGAVFPAEAVHRYGTTAVASAPRRIVTLGQTDHDVVVALGSVPIAVAGFVEGSYSALRPWNRAEFTTEPPVLNMQEIEFEKVAALGPDLILAVMSGITEQDYEKLTAIAPTVAQPVDYQDWAVPFRPHTELIGAALGQSARAAELVASLEDAFAGARRENPVLAGKSAGCAELWGSEFYVLGASAPRT